MIYIYVFYKLRFCTSCNLYRLLFCSVRALQGVSPGGPFPSWVRSPNHFSGDQSIFKLCLVGKHCVTITTRVTLRFIGGYIIGGKWVVYKDQFEIENRRGNSVFHYVCLSEKQE